MGKPTTSCKSCRRSRIGCNASLQPGQACFNCVRKGITCSKAAISVNKKQKKVTATQGTQSMTKKSHSQTLQPSMIGDSMTEDFCSNTSPTNGELAQIHPATQQLEWLMKASDTPARSQQASQLYEALRNLFTSLLEPRIGLCVCGVGNPFVTASKAPVLPISRLMIELDKNSTSTLWRGTSNPHTTGSKPHDSECDVVINRALSLAIYAYAVRWYHLVSGQSHDASYVSCRFVSLHNELSEHLWLRAQKFMYEILSKPSYRSIFALYLFAIIPTSPRKDRVEFADHCLQASLRSHNHLNCKARMLHIKQDPVMSLLGDNDLPRTYFAPLGLDESLRSTERGEESLASSAYWFSMVSDTTRALIRCEPSVLVHSPNSEVKVWNSVRQNAQDFSMGTSSLRCLRTPISDDQVVKILQHAFTFKTLVWAKITRVQDALVHHLSGDSLAEAVDAVRQESNRFEETFGHLLCMCQRDFMLLNRTTRICYMLLNIHFQVGNLILVDILPSTFNFIDQNLSPYDLRLCACRSIINALSLALQTQASAMKNVSVPNILLLDPYPDLMTNAIVRTGSSLFILHTMQKVTSENVLEMFEVVITALEVLAKISNIALEAIPLLKEKLATSGLSHNAGCNIALFSPAVIGETASVGQSSIQSDDSGVYAQQLNDCSAVEQFPNISDSGIGSDQSLNEIRLFEVDSLSQEWTFEDCLTDFHSFASMI